MSETRTARQPRARFGAALVLVISAGVLLFPLLTHGPLPRGSDVFSNTHYLQGFMKSFGEGDMYPRWTDETNESLGAPSFVMFPPLVFYAAGLAAKISGSILSGIKLYLSLLALATGLSFYWLAREWVGPGLPAAFGAGLYLLLPYHVLDMYQRFALSETTSFVFYPLILLFARRVLEGGPGRDRVGLSLSYAGLVYTHLVSGFLFSLFLGAWLLWESRGRFRNLLVAVLALTVGLAIAAPSLLPAAIEKSHANISWVREMPNGDYRINFIFRDDVLPGLGFRDPIKKPVLRSAHAQLLLAAVATLLALMWTPVDQRERRRHIVTIASACLAAYVLQLEVSAPVWRLVPGLSTVQFPWRFQTLMVLTTALVAGFALSSGWARVGHRRVMLAGIGAVGGTVCLASAAIVNLAFAAQNTALKPFDFDGARIRSEGVVHWSEPSFTPIEFEAYREFRQMRIDMPRVSFVEGEGKIQIDRWDSSTRVLSVESSSGGLIGVRSFWFPGWKAAVDGRPVSIELAPGLATMRFEVPAGRHRVELRFEATPVRRAAWWLWVAGLVATVVLGRSGPRSFQQVRSWKRRKGAPRGAPRRASSR